MASVKREQIKVKAQRMLKRKDGTTIEDMQSAFRLSKRGARNLIDQFRASGLQIENTERGSGRFHLSSSSR